MSSRVPPRQATISVPRTNDVSSSSSVEIRIPWGRSSHGAGTSSSNGGVHGSPIDVEAIEDEVEMLSPSRVFPQARNPSRRQQSVRIDLEEEEVTIDLEDLEVADVEVNVNPVRSGVPTEELVVLVNARNKHEIIPPNRTRKDVVKPSPEPKKTAPKEPTFTCPICMNPLVEASSTICGHVFCQSCIKASIEAHKKCPICTKNLAMSSFHRVYLPSAQ